MMENITAFELLKQAYKSYTLKELKVEIIELEDRIKVVRKLKSIVIKELNRRNGV